MIVFPLSFVFDRVQKCATPKASGAFFVLSILCYCSSDEYQVCWQKHYPTVMVYSAKNDAPGCK